MIENKYYTNNVSSVLTGYVNAPKKPQQQIFIYATLWLHQYFPLKSQMHSSDVNTSAYPYWDIKYPFIFLSDNLHLHISLWVAFFAVLIKVSIYIHDDIQLEELFILNGRHYGAESSPLCLQQLKD